MIPRKDLKYRVGNSFKNQDQTIKAQDQTIKACNFLVYVDARTVMDELDKKYNKDWSFQWEKVDYQEVVIKGKLSLTGNTHEDVGNPSMSKMPFKDAVSDALKRCAVQVGIGRFLYDAPFIYVEAKNLNLMENGKKISGYKPLTPQGEEYVNRRIDQWYNSVMVMPKEQKSDLPNKEEIKEAFRHQNEVKKDPRKDPFIEGLEKDKEESTAEIADKVFGDDFTKDADEAISSAKKITNKKPQHKLV